MIYSRTVSSRIIGNNRAISEQHLGPMIIIQTTTIPVVNFISINRATIQGYCAWWCIVNAATPLFGYIIANDTIAGYS